VSSADWPDSQLVEDVLPDGVVYALHGSLGEISVRLGGPPDFAATQWVKAASHARSSWEIRRASQGITAARELGGDVSALDSYICELADHGPESLHQALDQAKVSCPDVIWAEAPIGQHDYDSRSRTGG
jgi:hypothetical protein